MRLLRVPGASQPDYVFTVKVAMLEIYNEDVRDLLVETPAAAAGGGAGSGDGSAEGGKLEIRRDQDGMVQVRKRRTRPLLMTPTLFGSVFFCRFFSSTLRRRLVWSGLVMLLAAAAFGVTVARVRTVLGLTQRPPVWQSPEMSSIRNISETSRATVADVPRLLS